MASLEETVTDDADVTDDTTAAKAIAVTITEAVGVVDDTTDALTGTPILVGVF